jgi:hypothetical protein
MGGAVRYSKNGEVFYSSSAGVQYPLTVDAVVYDMNGAINDAKLVTAAAATAAPASSASQASAPSSPSAVEAVRWTSLVNAEAADNNLRKTAGCGGCADAAGTAEQLVRGNGGAFQFVADDVGAQRVVGLSSGGSGSIEEIEHAFRIAGGVAEVLESGAGKAKTRIRNGDVLTIAVGGPRIYYAVNGHIFHISRRTAEFPMAVGALLLDVNGTVAKAVVRSGS